MGIRTVISDPTQHRVGGQTEKVCYLSCFVRSMRTPSTDGEDTPCLSRRPGGTRGEGGGPGQGGTEEGALKANLIAGGVRLISISGSLAVKLKIVESWVLTREASLLTGRTPMLNKRLVPDGGRGRREPEGAGGGWTSTNGVGRSQNSHHRFHRRRPTIQGRSGVAERAARLDSPRNLTGRALVQSTGRAASFDGHALLAK